MAQSTARVPSANWWLVAGVTKKFVSPRETMGRQLDPWEHETAGEVISQLIKWTKYRRIAVDKTNSFRKMWSWQHRRRNYSVLLILFGDQTTCCQQVQKCENWGSASGRRLEGPRSNRFSARPMHASQPATAEMQQKDLELRQRRAAWDYGEIIDASNRPGPIESSAVKRRNCQGSKWKSSKKERLNIDSPSSKVSDCRGRGQISLFLTQKTAVDGFGFIVSMGGSKKEQSSPVGRLATAHRSFPLSTEPNRSKQSGKQAAEFRST
ncbi:hypothetical protein BJX64DRAFT_12206 [Aspergillus heterothallicus]